jgi:hypothetical protein
MISKNKYYGYSLLLTIISFISIFVLFPMKTKIYREDTNEVFSSYDPSKDSLYVNNVNVKNDSLIHLLKNIEKESDGRNTGKTKINIKLLKNNNVKYITLLRDFRFPKKYWVILKESETDNEGICIGEVNTNQFDKIEKVTE